MRVLFLFASLSISFLSFAQQSDFILVKKNQRTIRTLFAGSAVSFATATGTYTGRINKIESDSLFVVQYDIRKVFTNLGVYMIDTIATIQNAFHYKDLTSINKQTIGFNWAASGASLLGGGVLLTTAGLGTWIFTKPGTQYYAPAQLVIGSAVLAGAGYLLMMQNRQIIKFEKKYTLEYINTK
jgi:hypothetical protein